MMGKSDDQDLLERIPILIDALDELADTYAKEFLIGCDWHVLEQPEGIVFLVKRKSGEKWKLFCRFRDGEEKPLSGCLLPIKITFFQWADSFFKYYLERGRDFWGAVRVMVPKVETSIKNAKSAL